ncbi:excisionase family DNA binding protein [Chitinophaga dinghuensis]|uniref:Excisionase family DNA binding protein n=1 Tax=Chitinophaga dinghuensis TaxID=1539050 RepID=A0A327W5L1_9BACT|nr:helix-turn-helix domain-containing protein [Chitinophaga dinghuensis]RAJ83666.1 excisionase family DNA binding protein [Chitinophaga dinghuensis]
MQEQLRIIQEQVNTLSNKVDLLLQQTAKTEIPAGLLSVQQAAAYLHLSVSHVYYLLATGKIKNLQRQKYSRILFSVQDLQAYLFQQNTRCKDEK